MKKKIEIPNGKSMSPPVRRVPWLKNSNDYTFFLNQRTRWVHLLSLFWVSGGQAALELRLVSFSLCSWRRSWISDPLLHFPYIGITGNPWHSPVFTSTSGIYRQAYITIPSWRGFEPRILCMLNKPSPHWPTSPITCGFIYTVHSNHEFMTVKWSSKSPMF